MLSSMTGYGRGSATVEGFTFYAELRSVNHRYCDLSLRLPRELYFLEEPVRRLLQESIARGRVEVSLTLEKVPPGSCRVEVDHDLAAGYRRALSDLAGYLEIPGSVRLDHLIQLPDLFKPGRVTLTDEEVWPAAAAALEEALSRLLERRRSEGENLCRDLLARCDRLAELVGNAARRAPRAAEESRRRVEQKINELLGGQFDETRLLMECALLAERMGIDEELTRLSSHLAAARGILAGGEAGAAGRKLDFMAQEMFREVNTIGSKAGDYNLSQLVVEMKAELEKIREQVQNLE